MLSVGNGWNGPNLSERDITTSYVSSDAHFSCIDADSDLDHRGLIAGVSGCGISFGTMMSNWVGFACSYGWSLPSLFSSPLSYSFFSLFDSLLSPQRFLAPYGPVQWRLPLGVQIPWGIVMFIGLSTFMPNSPRQMIRVGKTEKARLEFIRIRKDLHSHEAQEEFALMRAQIEYEMEREIKSYKDIFKLFRHRALVCIAVQTMVRS